MLREVHHGVGSSVDREKYVESLGAFIMGTTLLRLLVITEGTVLSIEAEVLGASSSTISQATPYLSARGVPWILLSSLIAPT
jgi:hypothetical protein